MAEDDLLPLETRQTIEQIGSADLVIGLLGRGDELALDGLLAAIADQTVTLPRVAKAALVCTPDVAEAMGASPGPGPAVLACPPLVASPHRAGGSGAHTGLRALLAAGRAFEARACVALVPGADGVRFDWIGRLARPVLDEGLDLTMACHARPRLGGLINSGIVYPLVRALYGKRLRSLTGANCALSAALRDHCLPVGRTPGAPGAEAGLEGLACEAVAAGFRIGEVHLESWRPAAADPGDLSTALGHLLGPLFDGIERHASFWQKVRGSLGVPAFGAVEVVPDEGAPANVDEMIRSCQLGCRNLQEIWGVVLPPATLLEIKKLGRTAPERFAMSDELWARIVFDFALGYRFRVMNRDHLLRSLTPLYLGWAATFVREAAHAPAIDVERRIERLCLAYEAQKPYLLSRWRWPDRFNP